MVLKYISDIHLTATTHRSALSLQGYRALCNVFKQNTIGLRGSGNVGKISAPDHDTNVTDEATTSSNEVDEDEIVDKRGRPTSVVWTLRLGEIYNCA